MSDILRRNNNIRKYIISKPRDILTPTEAIYLLNQCFINGQTIHWRVQKCIDEIMMARYRQRDNNLLEEWRRLKKENKIKENYLSFVEQQETKKLLSKI